MSDAHHEAGTETLALRRERHVANARKVAEFLDAHDEVAWVNDAGLPGNRSRALAEKYLPLGPGAVFTFGVKSGYEIGLRLVESINCSAISPTSATAAR